MLESCISPAFGVLVNIGHEFILETTNRMAAIINYSCFSILVALVKTEVVFLLVIFHFHRLIILLHDNIFALTLCDLSQIKFWDVDSWLGWDSLLLIMDNFMWFVRKTCISEILMATLLSLLRKVHRETHVLRLRVGCVNKTATCRVRKLIESTLWNVLNLH